MIEQKGALKVSVIVPVYNTEKYLARCLDSLLNQTLPFYEIIIIDDGSTDSSGRLCDQYASSNCRIRVLHQENQGVSLARNAGIKMAGGEYITFADSDDYVSPAFNEILCSVAQETNADIIVGEMGHASDDCLLGVSRFSEITWHLYSADEYMDIFLRIHGNRCVHYPWGKLYRRGILERDLFPPGVANGEDAVAFFKVLTNADFIVEVSTSQPVYAYCLNSDSVTGSVFGTSYLDLPKVWNEIFDLALDRCPDYLEKVQYNRHRVWFTLICDSIVRGNSTTDNYFSEEIKRWRSYNKKNFGYLMRSPMAFSRKVLLMMVTWGFPVVRFAYRTLASKAMS